MEWVEINAATGCEEETSCLLAKLATQGEFPETRDHAECAEAKSAQPFDRICRDDASGIDRGERCDWGTVEDLGDASRSHDRDIPRRRLSQRGELSQDETRPNADTGLYA